MGKIRRKLRSRAGASLTFALLIFLVCAVLSSAIITAATTSAGRMSGIAETDRRYYAVTSAAELLKGLIDGKTVSIVNVKETEYTTTYSAGVAGTPEEGTSTTKTYVIPKKANEIVDADYLVEENQVWNAAYTIDSIPKDAADNARAETPASRMRMLTLASDFFEAAGLDYDALAMTIEERLDADGVITLKVYNKNKAKDTQSDAGSQYTLVLQFGVDKDETSDTKTESVSATDVNDTEYKVVEKTTQTDITTLTWHLMGIRTNAGGA